MLAHGSSRAASGRPKEHNKVHVVNCRALAFNLVLLARLPLPSQAAKVDAGRGAEAEKEGTLNHVEK